MARYVWGRNAVEACLERGGLKATRLYVLGSGGRERRSPLGAPGPGGEAEEKARALGLRVEARDRAWFSQLCKNSPHQGLVLELPDYVYADLAALLKSAGERAVLLALDQVEDPHNLGALARSAEAAGASGLVVPQDRGAAVTPAAEKAASGALARLPVARVVNLGRALEEAKRAGFWVYGLSAESPHALFEERLEGRVCLVLGAEGKGLRPGVASHCDKLLSIPMAGGAGSLNVSVAGGIALFEILRQTRRADPEGAGPMTRGGR